MNGCRRWEVGDLVRLVDTGETALIVEIADDEHSPLYSIKWIKIHTGETLAPWKINLISSVESSGAGREK